MMGFRKRSTLEVGGVRRGRYPEGRSEPGEGGTLEVGWRPGGEVP